jgi:hypothetical protein
MAAVVKVWMRAAASDTLALQPDEPLCNSAWPMGILLLNGRKHAHGQNRQKTLEHSPKD